jgi:hypothetical protein
MGDPKNHAVKSIRRSSEGSASRKVVAKPSTVSRSVQRIVRRRTEHFCGTKSPLSRLRAGGADCPQGARAAARDSQIGPIGARWLGIAARLACTHTGDGEPIAQRCAHSVDTRTSAWLNTRFRTGRPWLWRVSPTRRTSVERIMPSGTNDCPTELSSRVTRRHKNSSSETGFDSPQG